MAEGSDIDRLGLDLPTLIPRNSDHSAEIKYNADELKNNQDSNNAKNDLTTTEDGHDTSPTLDLPVIAKLAIVFGNINCLVALFIFILCLFFSFVSFIYGFGQILELKLTNYW